GLMSGVMLVAVDRPDVVPLPITPKLRAQLVYFMTPAETAGIPPLGEREYWIARADVGRWLAEGVFQLLSPLDSANVAEIELTDEQESMLGWLDRHGVEHVRIIE